MEELKIEMETLRSKCRSLESSSPYATQFDAYERETRIQLRQIDRLKEANVELAKQLTAQQQRPTEQPTADMESSTHTTAQKRGIAERVTQRTVARLERERTALKEENITLQQKARCYDFFKYAVRSPFRGILTSPVFSENSADY